jgi:hypothetical protein
LHVAPPDGLHEFGCACLGFRRDQQVDVVGHEYIKHGRHSANRSRFFQPVEVTVVILLGVKAGLSIDSALDNMLRYSG